MLNFVQYKHPLVSKNAVIQSFIEIKFLLIEIKNLDLQINLTFDFVMTVVGILTFTSLINIFEQLNLTTMQKVKTTIINLFMSLLFSVSCGVTFVE